MASSSGTSDSHVLFLVLVLLLLPFHLLSLASRLFIPKSNTNNKKKRWILPCLSIPLLLSATIFALSDLDSSSSSSKDAGSVSDFENSKLKISELESILEENTNILNSKNLQLDENNRLIEEMEHKIQFLQNSLSAVKTSIASSSSDSETIVRAMEEEVRLLWAESRKNNFNYHILESKAREEDKKVEAATSGVAKMEDIITEQWIQIQQLEQSLQMMKIMTSKVHKKSTSSANKRELSKFTLLKFLKGVRNHYQPEIADLPDTFFLGNYISKSCTSQASGQLRRIWTAVKKWHYELQDSVKWAFEMNEFTARLANEEIVFFVASAILTIPVMSAWVLFS